MTPMVGSQGWVRILLGRAGLGSLMDIRSWQVSGALRPGGQVGQGSRGGKAQWRTRGDRHSSRVEATNPALLSSRDGYLLELTGWTKGSQAS